MTSFLNCAIWSINGHIIDDNGFAHIRKVYWYDSNTDEFNTPIPPGFIQIPEFEIGDLHLLDRVDYDFINEYKIPIIRRDKNNKWKIDLTYYENTYLQYSSS